MADGSYYTSDGRGPVRPPLLYRAAFGVLAPLVRIAFRPRVTGAERVQPGGLVLVANHLSGLDTLALVPPLRHRWVLQMGKPQLFARRPVAAVLRRLGIFPARAPSRDGATSVDLAAALAGQGFAVMILPEGARRRGRVLRPRTGAARAALDAGVPVVPAAVMGTDGWRRLQRWHVVFGDPIALDDLAGTDVRAAAQRATERIWAEVLQLEASLGDAGSVRDGPAEP